MKKLFDGMRFIAVPGSASVDDVTNLYGGTNEELSQDVTVSSQSGVNVYFLHMFCSSLDLIVLVMSQLHHLILGHQREGMHELPLKYLQFE